MCIEDKNHFSTHKLAHNQQTATAVLWSLLCEPHSLFVTIILNNLKFRSIFKYNRIRYACYTCKPASILSQSHSPSPSPSLTHSFIDSFIRSLTHSTAPNRPTLFYFIFVFSSFCFSFIAYSNDLLQICAVVWITMDIWNRLNFAIIYWLSHSPAYA